MKTINEAKMGFLFHAQDLPSAPDEAFEGAPRHPKEAVERLILAREEHPDDTFLQMAQKYIDLWALAYGDEGEVDLLSPEGTEDRVLRAYLAFGLKMAKRRHPDADDEALTENLREGWDCEALKDLTLPEGWAKGIGALLAASHDHKARMFEQAMSEGGG